MIPPRLFMARVVGVAFLLFSFLALKYSPRAMARPLFAVIIGVLCLAIACGVFGNERRRVFWYGFAVFIALYSILGAVELFRFFGKVA